MSSSTDRAGDESLLKARSDLTVEQQVDGFILHDPIKSSFVRLGVAEYLVFRHFDGQSSVHDIARRLAQERDVQVNPEDLARLRDRLHSQQLIMRPDEAVVAEEASVSDGSGLVHRLIYIDPGFAFDPDLFLARLYHRIKHICFRPAFFVALFIGVCLTVQIWLANWDQVLRHARELDLSSALLFYPVFVVTVFIHEVGHGVTTKGFGGRVPRMGSFLYFFVVVFYTDVSASWMFPSKFHRLMVLLAGAITNVALCAIATILWFATEPGTLGNDIFFAFMSINALGASFTLFPLLRGDGYYILSTALDIPNLRQNAHRYTRSKLRRRLWNRQTEVPRATPRESLVYLIYSPLQIAFFIGFFGYVAVKTVDWLITSYGFWGFWIAALVAIDRLARPIFRALPRAMGAVADALRGGLGSGLLAMLASARATVRHTLLRAGPLIAGALVLLLALVPYPYYVTAPFEIVSVSPVAVRPKVSGIIDHYVVENGQWVEAGDTVAYLVHDELLLRKQALEASLHEAQAHVRELEAGYRGEEIAQAEAVAGAEQSSARLAGQALRRARLLFEEGVATADAYDRARAGSERAAARAQRAEVERERRIRGHRQERLDMARARAEVLERTIAQVHQRLEWSAVRAVSSGRVVTPNEVLDERAGRFVRRGDTVLDLLDPGTIAARISVPDRFLADLETGQDVTVRFFNEPGDRHQGVVQDIEAQMSDGHVGVLTRIHDLTEVPQLGTTGYAKIDTGSHGLLSSPARRAWQSGWVVFWSWW